MDCFSCKCPDAPSARSVIVRAIDGYMMRAPYNAQIQVLGADGVTAFKPIDALRAGDLLVLNTARSRARPVAQARARMWLFGALIPLVHRKLDEPLAIIADREIATPRADLASLIMEKVARSGEVSAAAPPCELVTSPHGIHYVRSDVFVAIFAKCEANNGMTFAGCAKLAQVPRKFHAALISGLCAGGGYKRDDGAFVLPAISTPFAMLILNALLKFGVRARDEGAEIVITARESIAAFRELISKAAEQEATDKAAIAVATTCADVPGFGSRAPAIGSPILRRTPTMEALFGVSPPPSAPLFSSPPSMSGRSSPSPPESAPLPVLFTPRAQLPIIPRVVDTPVVRVVLSSPFEKLELCN